MNREDSDAEMGDCHDSATESTALLPERRHAEQLERGFAPRKAVAPPLDRVSLWLYHSSQFYFLCGCLINDYVVVVFYSNGGRQTAVTQTMNLLAYFLWVLNPVYDLFFAMRTHNRRTNSAVVETLPHSTTQSGPTLDGLGVTDPRHIAGKSQNAAMARVAATVAVDPGPSTPHFSNGSSASVSSIKTKGNGPSMRSGGQLCGGTNLCMPVAFVVASLLYMAAVALPIYCSSNGVQSSSPHKDGDAGARGGGGGTPVILARQAFSDRFCDPDLVNLTNFAASLIMFCGAVSSCVACSSPALRSPLRQLHRCKRSVSVQLKAVMCFTRDSFSKGRHFLQRDGSSGKRGAHGRRQKNDRTTSATPATAAAAAAAIEDSTNEASYPGNATSVLVCER